MLLLNPAPKPFGLLPEPYVPKNRAASHLYPALDDLDLVVERTIEVLSGYDFDAIAFQGLSGALVAPIVAMKMKKSILAVRKPDERRHSIRDVEGDYATRRYVILDDFVSSGTTLRRILQSVFDVLPRARCIGMVEYVAVKEGLQPIHPADMPKKNPTRVWAGEL